MSTVQGSNQNCHNCNTPLKPNARFCGKCGTQITNHVSTVSNSKSNPPTSNPSTSRPPTFALGLILVGVLTLLFVLMNPAEKSKGSDHKKSKVSNDSEVTMASPKKSSNTNTVHGSNTETDNPNNFEYTYHQSTCSSENLVQVFREQASIVDQIIRSGPTHLTLEEEKELGRDTLNSLEEALGGTLTQDGSIAEYIADLGSSLLFNLKRTEITYEFYLLEGSDMENALALPGGHVIVTRALFDNWIENEAQLATILGHEIAHIDNKHVIAAYDFAKRVNPNMADNELMMTFIQLLSRGLYSVERESEADATGAEKIHQLGYSTFQSVALWEKQSHNSSQKKNHQNNNQGLFGEILDNVLENTEEILATHPGAATRACRLKRETYRLYQSSPLETPYKGIANYKNRKTKVNKVY